MRNARHLVIMAVLVIVVAILTYLALNSLGLMPVEASAQSIEIDWLFDLEVKMIAFFFALIMVPLIYSLVVFRRKEGDETDAEHIEGNTGLEITWTAIPLVIVIALGIIGAVSAGFYFEQVVSACGPAGGTQNAEPGCFAFFLGAGIPCEAGCCAGPRGRLSHYPQQDWRI